MKLLQKSIKFNESYENYGKSNLPYSYNNIKRTNGMEIYPDHILDTLHHSRNLNLHPDYSDLFSGLVLFHDFSEDFKAYFNSFAPNTFMMQVYNPFQKILMPKSIEIITLNHFLKGKEQSNLLLYGVYKISKNIGEDSQTYISEVLKKSNKRDVDFSLVSKEDLKTIDLLVCLTKICDIYSNNRNFLETSVKNKEHFSFRGKKTRNSLERLFLDIPNFSRRVEEDKNFKINNLNLFNNYFAQKLLIDTQQNIYSYFENFDIIETLNENNGLGSKVTNKNYQDYQKLLNKLYELKPSLFSEKPNLEKVMRI